MGPVYSVMGCSLVGEYYDWYIGNENGVGLIHALRVDLVEREREREREN